MFGIFMIQKQDDPIKKVYDECINALSEQKLQNQQKCPKEYNDILCTKVPQIRRNCFQPPLDFQSFYR